jgi:hypothetical protein
VKLEKNPSSFNLKNKPAAVKNLAEVASITVVILGLGPDHPATVPGTVVRTQHCDSVVGAPRSDEN